MLITRASLPNHVSIRTTTRDYCLLLLIAPIPNYVGMRPYYKPCMHIKEFERTSLLIGLGPNMSKLDLWSKPSPKALKTICSGRPFKHEYHGPHLFWAM